MKRFFTTMTLCTLALTSLQAQSWVLPWVANKDDAWASELAINNHSTEPAELSLTAIRPNGEQETVSVNVPGNGQLTLDAGATFEALGSGSGYSVFIKGSDINISAAVKIKSLATDSGDSPALGHAVRLEEGMTSLVFQFMPYSQGGAAAPVIVNLAEVEAHLTLLLYDEDHSTPLAKEMVLAAKTPFADVIANLFPESTANSYLIVQSDQPVAGMSFSFNTIREPSTMNAQAVAPEFTEEDLAAFMATLDTGSQASSSYVQATSGLFDLKKPNKSDNCPAVDVDININNSDSFISAHFDWGDGCTNVFGVTSKGAIQLDMVREGKLTEAAWMNGTLAFEDYEVRYLASNFALDGYLHMEGSVRSDNFTLNGEWEGRAVSPFYGVHATYQSNSYLSINKKTDHHEVYGHLNVTASQFYYFSMQGMISQSDPLIYNYDVCPWPTSGTISLTINWGYPVSGFLDFRTGDCNTAILNVAGVQTTLYLPGIYTY